MLSEFIIGITSSLVTVFVTYIISLSKFRSERWWDQKLDAYLKIIEALNRQKKYLEVCMEEETEGAVYTESFKTKLNEKSSLALEELNLQKDRGNFLISEKALLLIENLLFRIDEASHAPTFLDYVDLSLDAIENCRNDFLPLAKEDLERKHWVIETCSEKTKHAYKKIFPSTDT